jgi:hypothetical protein
MNESMTHSVYLAPAGTGADSEDTSVYYEPELSGSKKIKLRGLPDGCATRDFTVRARVQVANVRRVTATLSSPQTEWGGRLGGGRKREQVRDDQLNFEVPAETLKDAHYDLKFVATRKGAPNLKRTVEFQVC